MLGPSEGVRDWGRVPGAKRVANECEENMVIFHKNRQMRTQPEARQKQGKAKIKENV